MNIIHYTGKDGKAYTYADLQADIIPDEAYPLVAKHEPPAPRDPNIKVHAVPLNIWDDTGPYGAGMESRLLVFSKKDIPAYEPPPKREHKIAGYTKVAEGDPYFFSAECPLCGTKLSRISSSSDSWSHTYACPSCHCIVEMSEGDKMGGSFDHWECFKPNKP